MKKLIKIPAALQIRVDDVAWHNGTDTRAFDGTARTGMPRMHHIDDYKVLNELGKAIDMKIACSLVLGEWDKDNILRGEPHVTPNPDTWDRASEINMSYAQECFNALESSEFLDYTLHGLMHAYFDNGKHINGRQYYPPKFDKENNCYTQIFAQLPIDEFRRHIELFFKIYDSWGFKKKVNYFASPCGCIGTPEENANYCEVLKDHGIYFWNNSWSSYPNPVAVSNGVICVKAIDIIEWNVYDLDPDLLIDAISEDDEFPRTDLSTHWPNFLRFHPEYNFRRLDKWVNYFNRQSEIFGCILSKDTAFADSQALYSGLAKINIEDNKCIIDLSDVDSKGAIGKKDEFYISFKNEITPKSCLNGQMEHYQTKKEFNTYKITRKDTKEIIIEL